MVLKGISPLISPDLLYNLYIMGHGDEIVFADAHFPGYSFNQKIIRADGIQINDLLKAILPLFELDTYETPCFMMDVVKGDTFDEKVELNYLKSIKDHSNLKLDEITKIERFQFYERAKKSFCIVMTSDTTKYGNLILKKGVTPFK